ncbi:hypothetical protein FHS31_000875 [Sphingomonas vulcanisoli]|uniref:Spore coat protein U domain-containing protein n=1 Tax=Sphingomonas vulcanisoli TaxID=1658060 RepID=A0ABX0TT10_9SPHN|nr:hypothetical protein [Sphingomonas vulcanisoli]NIJ07279.1 hypothetical protein [Sphingomonas vulcanisoli]
MKSLNKFAGLLLPALILSCPASADAGTVNFAGTVVNTCVINLTTPGALGMATTGTQLSSDNTGGLAASVTVVATGTAPTLQFGAPQLTGPAGSIAGATKMIGYTSNGGANQPLTSGTSIYAMTRLLDTLTVKAEADNSSGFATGVYGIAATVTCQQ